jgi:hypothetical protein
MATTDKQQRVPLAEAWRLFTGQEPPVLTPEEIAEFDAKRDAVEEQARRIYGDTPA